MKTEKLLLPLFIILALAAGVFLIVVALSTSPQDSSVADGDSALVIVPSNLNLGLGATQEIQIRVSNPIDGINAAAVRMRVNGDAISITNVAVTLGLLGPIVPCPGGQLFTTTEICFDVAAASDFTDGQVLATVTIQAVNAGVSTVDFIAESELSNGVDSFPANLNGAGTYTVLGASTSSTETTSSEATSSTSTPTSSEASSTETTTSLSTSSVSTTVTTTASSTLTTTTSLTTNNTTTATTTRTSTAGYSAPISTSAPAAGQLPDTALEDIGASFYLLFGTGLILLGVMLNRFTDELQSAWRWIAKRF